MDILNFVIDNAGLTVASLAALEILGAFFLPAAIVAKIPKIIRIVHITTSAVKKFNEVLKKWEETEGGFSEKKAK